MFIMRQQKQRLRRLMRLIAGMTCQRNQSLRFSALSPLTFEL
jgi:hypothetical protein